MSRSAVKEARSLCCSFILILPLASGIAIAGPEVWMKKENPNELIAVIFHDSRCPATRDALVGMIEGVFVRSRIRLEEEILEPAAHSTFPWLLVRTQCGESNVYSAHVDFIGENEKGFRYRLGVFGYGVGGQHGGDMEYFLGEIRASVEAAITDYLKANFDL